MWSADSLCAHKAPLRIEPEVGKVTEDSIESQPKVACDVLQEHDTGSHFANDSSNPRPKVPGIIFAEPLPSITERLARVSRSDEIHDAAPRSAVEGSQVVPDRSAIQGRLVHPRHKGGRCSSVPFNMTHGPKVAAEGQADAEVEAPVPGT